MSDRRDTDLIALREELERIERKMDVVPAARRLPVWTRAALLGAGLALAAGCADKPPTSTNPTREPARVEADAPEAPGMSPPPAPEAEAKDRVVVMTARGVYGAPPARRAAISMIKIKKGVVKTNTPGTKPAEIVAFVSVKYDWSDPRSVTKSARNYFEGMRGAIDECLTTAMQKDDLQASGFSMDLEFAKGRLKSATLRNDQALPEALRTCLRGARDTVLAVLTDPLPQGDEDFEGKWSFDVSW